MAVLSVIHLRQKIPFTIKSINLFSSFFLFPALFDCVIRGRRVLFPVTRTGEGWRRHMPRKGHVAVRVGPEGEEQCRLVVPVRYLSHPAFVSLLEDSERVYGFDQQGPIAIPCSIDHFRRVLDVIQHNFNGSGHPHLPRFAGCFRA